MGHTDVVNVDPKKWTHPPFSATRDGGYVYGRGTVDDKDNLTAALMVMLTLKRLNVPLDRDVIFLAEAGEEGPTRVGIQFMVEPAFPGRSRPSTALPREAASRARVARSGSRRSRRIEKIPRAIELTATGAAGHGSVPLLDNRRRAPGRRSREGRRAGTRRSASTRRPAPTSGGWRRSRRPSRRRATATCSTRTRSREADRWFKANEPRHAALLHTTASPTIIDGGYRVNVIPSEAKATHRRAHAARRRPGRVPGAGPQGGRTTRR